jgi:hypothetical protein
MIMLFVVATVGGSWWALHIALTARKVYDANQLHEIQDWNYKINSALHIGHQY